MARWGAVLTAAVISAGCGSNSLPDGNVDIDDVRNYDSVGFILDDGEYSFFAMPDASWTRIIGLDEDGDSPLVAYAADVDGPGRHALAPSAA